MTIPQGEGSRNVGYPLDRSIEFSPNGTPQEETVAFLDLSEWPTVDGTERVRLVFDWSLEEFVAMATAIDIGRDIGYGGNSGIIWWTWIRGLVSMSICDDVANCISENQSVQDAITNYLIESGITSPNTIDPDSTNVDERMPQATQQSDISSTPSGCDQDILWAGIREMVTRLDDQARQILEQAQVINDIYQRYANLVAAIPILGDLAADISNNFTEVIPDMLNSFNAYSSVSNMDDLACELFELVCSDCKYPTYEQVADTVASHAFGTLINWEAMSLATVVSQFIQTGTYTPTLVWHSMLLFELFTLYIGGKFGSASGSKTLTQWVKLGEDIPSNDWETLCGPCGVTEYPQLVNTRCEDSFTAGTFVQTAPDTWDITGEIKAPGPGNYLCIEDAQGRRLDIVDIFGTGGPKPTSVKAANNLCQYTSKASTLGLIGDNDVWGVYFATANLSTPMTFTIKFGPVD